MIKVKNYITRKKTHWHLGKLAIALKALIFFVQRLSTDHFIKRKLREIFSKEENFLSESDHLEIILKDKANQRALG